MIEITKSYKQLDLPTLRLPVDFEKLKWDDDVILAYNVLINKGKKKSEYTEKAVKHYKSVMTNRTVRNAITNIQNMKNLMSKYSVENEEQLVDLLENTDIARLSKEIPEIKTPRKMLLGFNLDSASNCRNRASAL